MIVYLFLGEDKEQKTAKIAELKSKYLSSRESFEFDYEPLYGHKLEPDTLKKALIALPAVSPQRVVLIRECDKLSPQNRDILLECIQDRSDKTVVMLDSNVLEVKDSFVTKLKVYAKVIDFQRQVPANVFDMTRAIGLKKSQEALAILFQMLSSGTHPLQIMGGVVWFWGRSRERLPAQRFKLGLAAMQEADLNIKRSRLKPEYALELLVVKLCSLI